MRKVSKLETTIKTIVYLLFAGILTLIIIAITSAI